MPRGLLTRITHVTVSRPTSGLGCSHRHPLDPWSGNNDLPSVDIDCDSDNTETERLAEIYREAVRVLGSPGYSGEQTRVWAMHSENLNAFHESLWQGLTLCAVIDGSPVAFGQLYPVDHITYLYSHPAHVRRGFASAILVKLEEHAQKQQPQIFASRQVS